MTSSCRACMPVGMCREGEAENSTNKFQSLYAINPSSQNAVNTTRATRAKQTFHILSYGIASNEYQPARSPKSDTIRDAPADEGAVQRASKTRTRIGGCCAGGSVTKVKSMTPASLVEAAALWSTRPRCARSVTASVARASVATPFAGQQRQH